MFSYVIAVCMTGHAPKYGAMNAIPSYLGTTTRPRQVGPAVSGAEKNFGDPLVSRRTSRLHAPYLSLKKSTDSHWWCIEIHPEELRHRRRRAPNLSQKKNLQTPTGDVSNSIFEKLRCRWRRACALYLAEKKSGDPHPIPWWCIEIRPEELRYRRRRASYLSPKKSEDPTGGISKSILGTHVRCSLSRNHGFCISWITMTISEDINADINGGINEGTSEGSNGVTNEDTKMPSFNEDVNEENNESPSVNEDINEIQSVNEGYQRGHQRGSRHQKTR